MNTEVLSASTPEALKRAIETLRSGGLVAFPTDTVYGLGALVWDGQAVQSIFAAKDRSEDKAIPILLADKKDLHLVVIEIPEMARRLADRFWPGPLTLVMQKQPNLPAPVSATSTVGVRVPDHPVTLALLKAVGPMAVTSANLSGRASPRSADEVREQLRGRIALILDGGLTPGGNSSTVVDCTGTAPTILRAGPLSVEDIDAALG